MTDAIVLQKALKTRPYKGKNQGGGDNDIVSPWEFPILPQKYSFRQGRRNYDLLNYLDLILLYLKVQWK
jgi:hypothetical protein